MTERESAEVEKVLLHISDTRSRAHRGVEALEKAGGAAHLVDALRSTEQQLAGLHRTLSQETYYAIPEETLRLTV